MDFDSCCAQAEGTSLIPWEDGSAAGLKSRLGVWTSGGDSLPSVNIFIGPKGGFTGDEVDTAGANGLIPVTLGKRILRAETAGLVAASAILYQLGDLGGGRKATLGLPIDELIANCESTCGLLTKSLAM